MFHPCHPRFRHSLTGFTLLIGAVLSIGTIGLAGCGGGSDASNTAASDGVAEVHINSDDQMRFDLEQFTVQPGQTVRLTLVHTGQMAVEQMGHNVVILGAGEQPVAFGTEIGREGGNMSNEYVPESMRDRVVAFTRMIGGGESDTIEFTAPDQAGEYPFICSFPGHYSIMQGVMIVGN